MPRRPDLSAGVALALIFGLLAGCAKPIATAADVGRHHVRFVVPKDWEHLDHGRQQLIRHEEWQISLTDLGPATGDGMVLELGAARELWLEGRRKDAFERVRELRSPALELAASPQLSEFWRPWYDVTYVRERADSASIGLAFDSLLTRAREFPEPAPDVLVGYVLALTNDRPGREIASQRRRTIHGSDWTIVDTWNRVSHEDRSRFAFLEDHGFLLALATEQGPIEALSPAFDSILESCEVTPRPPAP